MIATSVFIELMKQKGSSVYLGTLKRRIILFCAESLAGKDNFAVFNIQLKEHPSANPFLKLE